MARIATLPDVKLATERYFATSSSQCLLECSNRQDRAMLLVWRKAAEGLRQLFHRRRLALGD